jgi:hypothetical protein
MICVLFALRFFLLYFILFVVDSFGKMYVLRKEENILSAVM